jgi:uncharacterized HAD superfamily protein
MTKKLRIGLDIDDVLIRTGEHTVKLYNDMYGTNATFEHWYHFDVPELWGVSDISEAVKRVRLVTELDAFDDVKPVDGALDAIVSFTGAGHEVFAITGRPENVRVQTLRILNKYYPGLFSNETLYFTDHYGDSGAKLNKTEIALNLKLDYFVDDQVFHANDMHEANIKTILFSDNYQWNKSGEIDGVIRVSNWKEIGTIISA